MVCSLLNPENAFDDRLRKAQRALNDLEQRIYDHTKPATVSFTVKATDERLVENGRLKDHAFLGCGDIEELVIGEGVTKFGQYFLKGLPGLRRIRFPRSADGSGRLCGHESIEEISFAEGSRFQPSVWNMPKLRKVVWPSGCTTCGAAVFEDCSNLEEVVGLEVVKKMSAKAFERTPIPKCKLNEDAQLIDVDLEEPLPSVFAPVLEKMRGRSELLLESFRDAAKSTAERVDAWLELTSSKGYIAALPENVWQKIFKEVWPVVPNEVAYGRTIRGNQDKRPKSDSASVRKVLDEIEKDNYAAMRLMEDLYGVRLTSKYISYAWDNRKNGIITGLLRDRHPKMLTWLEEMGGAKHVMKCNYARPDLVEALEACCPGIVQDKMEEGTDVLWSLFAGMLYRGELQWHVQVVRLWAAELERETARRAIEACRKLGARYIAMGLDPNAKHPRFGFSWQDVMDGQARRFR